MSQNLIGGLDFESGAVSQNIKGIVYQGYGIPQANALSPTNAGAIYVDMLTNQVWTCHDATNNLWKPYHSNVTSITIDTDVQEGDFVGLYGLGAWSTSGALSEAKDNLAGSGSQFSAFTSGGNNSAVITTSAIFNGSAWYSTGSLSKGRQAHGGEGSVNLGIAFAGAADNATAYLSSTELFNGSTWSNSNNLSQSKISMASGGTGSATWGAGGILPSAAVLSITELYNGTSWSTSGNTNLSKAYAAGIGTQSSGLCMGGRNASTAWTNTEVFNGTAWAISSNMSQSRLSFGTGGSAFAAFVAGSWSSGSKLNSTELFNGTTWIASGNLSETKGFQTSAGNTVAGMIAGGINASSALVATTELHAQTTYRKLNYRNLFAASNFGVAYNVNTTNYTAYLVQGSVPTYRIPGQMFFGISPWQGEDNYSSTKAYVSAAVNISSISAPVNGVCQTTVTLPGLCPGMLVEIVGATTAANNGLFPVTAVSGNGTFTISYKNPNGVLQAGAGGTIAVVYGDRLSLTVSGISVGGGIATIGFGPDFSGLSSAQFTRYIKIGQVIYIPYSTNPANGSKYNFGAYLITGINAEGTVTVATINPAAQNESGLSFRAELLQQYFVSAVAGPTEGHTLGFNGQMRLPYSKANDDLENGFY